jgi:hypothetical protein
MMYKTLQRMKDLLIGLEMFINLRQHHAKTRNCSETQVAPKVLHKLTNYSDIMYLFLHPQN